MYSRNFRLGKGRPQGDPPSPIQYNLAEQILLFKIELCTTVNPIYNVQVLPVPAPVALPAAESKECQRETSTADAFADDTTVNTYATFENLSSLKNILDNFGAISGLKCNVNKSYIMRIGARLPLSDQIKNLGFAESDSIKILGLDIDHNLDCIKEIHDTTVRKIESIANFWKRFNLSLPGRINIAKTLLLSQISYLGCILTPTDTQYEAMSAIIEHFIRKNLNISKQKIYLPVN